MTKIGNLVQCNKCGATTVIFEHGKNIHDTLNCACCGEDHKHADPFTGMTISDTCRTVTITAHAVVIPDGE